MFGCMYICAPHVCLVPAETRRRYCLPLNKSLVSSLESPCGCWKENLYPLQDQPVFNHWAISSSSRDRVLYYCFTMNLICGISPFWLWQSRSELFEVIFRINQKVLCSHILRLGHSKKLNKPARALFTRVLFLTSSSVHALMLPWHFLSLASLVTIWQTAIPQEYLWLYSDGGTCVSKTTAGSFL